jgi:ATP-binding cassette, subfamily B, bacterial
MTRWRTTAEAAPNYRYMTAQSRWTTLARLVALLWSAGRRELTLVLAVSAVGSLGPLASVWLLKLLIDSALMALAGATAPAEPFGWLAALLGVTMVLRLTALAGGALGEDLQERLRARVQERLLVKAHRLPLVDFERPERFDQLHQAQRGLDTRLLMTLQNLIPLPATLVTAASLALFFGTLSPWMPLLLLAGTIPGALLFARHGVETWYMERNRTPDERLHSAVRDLLIERPAAAEVRLFGLQTHLRGRERALFDSLRGHRLLVRRNLARVEVVEALLSTATLALTLVWMVALVGAGQVSVGALGAGLAAIRQFGDAVANAMYMIVATDGDLRYIGDLLDYLDLPEEPAGSAAVRDQAADRNPPAVEFDDVCFQYPGAERPALAGVSFTLRPGERVALVGENGAGKSTLARLLLGLYAPTGGRILVDDRPLAQEDLPHWRTRVAAVFQDYVRFAASAGENIGFGDPARQHSQTVIEAAARASGADAVLAQLPQGADTPLGKEFDPGAHDLSSGQWQRLALARAYLRDAPLVVLDEPTAALDARAEVEVYRQFRDVSHGRSVVLISHRLGSARLADRILVLEHGRVVEQGSHAELVARGGRYAEMYRLQAAWYE